MKKLTLAISLVVGIGLFGTAMANQAAAADEKGSTVATENSEAAVDDIGQGTYVGNVNQMLGMSGGQGFYVGNIQQLTGMSAMSGMAGRQGIYVGNINQLLRGPTGQGIYIGNIHHLASMSGMGGMSGMSGMGGESVPWWKFWAR